MKEYRLYREQILPVSIKEAWDFFSNPFNLDKITPPDMRFLITAFEYGLPIYQGMKIGYSVSPLFYIPIRWLTEIKHVKAPYTFTDVQLKGPYKKWEHTHIFEEVENGVKMTDVVVYALPFAGLGILMHRLLIKKRLTRIFDYREKFLKQIFA